LNEEATFARHKELKFGFGIHTPLVYGSDEMKHSEAFVKLVDEAKSRVKEISPEEVLSMIDKKQAFHFVDVREDNEWEAGHAVSAIHMGRGVIERDIEKQIENKSDLVVLYCGGGFRSALAADNIQKMGYTNVLSMAGGMRLWREKAYPETKN
jgi:rhodanese-related sulfurtransferase